MWIGAAFTTVVANLYPGIYRMNLHRISIASILSVFAIAGCASDPSKKVSAAEAELTSDHQKALTKEKDENAETTRNAETARAETKADKTLATSDATKDVHHAHVDLAQDRHDFDVKAKERLAKADAKVRELKTKSAKLKGAKASSFNTHYATFTTLRDETSSKVNGLGASGNAEWSSAKAECEKKLDNVEATVASMESDF